MMASEILMLIGSIVISTLKGPESLSERLIRDSEKEDLDLELGDEQRNIKSNYSKG